MDAAPCVEDEAVVAAMLKQAKGSLKLLDMSKELPNLRRTPGVKTWEVWDKFGKHDTFDGPEVGVRYCSIPTKLKL